MAVTDSMDEAREEGWDECIAMVSRYVSPFVIRKFAKNPYRKEEDDVHDPVPESR